MNKSQFIIDMNHSFSLCLVLFTYNTTGWFSSYLSFINQTAKAVWESLQFQTSLKVLKPSDPTGGVCSTVFHWLHDLLSTHRRATMKNIYYIPSIYLEKTPLSHSSFKRNESQQRLRFFGGSLSSSVSINPAIAAVRLRRVKHQ